MLLCIVRFQATTTQTVPFVDLFRYLHSSNTSHRYVSRLATLISRSHLSPDAVPPKLIPIFLWQAIKALQLLDTRKLLAPLQRTSWQRYLRHEAVILRRPHSQTLNPLAQSGKTQTDISTDSQSSTQEPAALVSLESSGRPGRPVDSLQLQSAVNAVRCSERQQCHGEPSPASDHLC